MQQIDVFSGAYPADVAKKATQATEGRRVTMIVPTFDQNNHYVLTVVSDD